MTIRAISVLIGRVLIGMDLRRDGNHVDPAHVLLSVSYTGSPVPELVAYFPLHEAARGMHRLQFQDYYLDTKDDGSNIRLRDNYWIPFFYAPE